MQIEIHGFSRGLKYKILQDINNINNAINPPRNVYNCVKCFILLC